MAKRISGLPRYKYSSEEMKGDIVGRKFENNSGEEFVVIRKSDHKNKSSNYNYIVRFTATGYERDVEKVQIRRGQVRDVTQPSVYGIGVVGEVKMSDFKREYNVWAGMLERCYHKKCNAYYRYGGLGVTVCERWKQFEYFLNDLHLVEGYDEQEFKSGKLELDKDIKQQDKPVKERVYSSETCMFVSKEINHKYRDIEHTKTVFEAINPSGDSDTYNGIKSFCREHPELHRILVTKCLKGKREEYQGWRFKLISSGSLFK